MREGSHANEIGLVGKNAVSLCEKLMNSGRVQVQKVQKVPFCTGMRGNHAYWREAAVTETRNKNKSKIKSKIGTGNERPPPSCTVLYWFCSGFYHGDAEAPGGTGKVSFYGMICERPPRNPFGFIRFYSISGTGIS